jgi:hypothetical protein
LADTQYGPELSPGDTPKTDGILARLRNPNLASAVAALASTVSGPDPSRTAASVTVRLARITRISFVDGQAAGTGRRT